MPGSGDLGTAMNTSKARSGSRPDRAEYDPPTPVQPIAAQRHLNQIDLARRWRVSPRTLERWRWRKIGPAYLKVGNHVVYRVEDVEAYEAGRRRTGVAA